MKALAVLICLAGSAGLWSWAYLTPKPPDPLPEKYCGAFELFRYEVPANRMADDPLARGQRWVYEFGADHIYTFRVQMQKGYEMSRRSGVITIEVTPEGNEILVMTQHTGNGVAEPAEPLRYLAEWGSDEGGPYLQLSATWEEQSGEQWFLRRVQP